MTEQAAGAARKAEKAMMRPCEAIVDPEQPVVEAIRQGDADAMAEFMDRQGSWVRGLIFAVTGRTDDLDDVVQRVWIQVWRQIGKLEDAAHWRAWLYSIVRNAAQDSNRQRVRRTRLQRAAMRLRRWWSAVAPPAEAPLEQRDLQAAVLNAIAELPEIYRVPFVLRHLERQSYARIGELLGISEEGVETRLVRARRRLRDRLKPILDASGETPGKKRERTSR